MQTLQRLLDILTPEQRALALTHPAFAPTHADSFERLEFLGDSVLGLVITAAVHQRHPELDEGDLSKVRAGTVSRDSCAEVARRADLGGAMVEHARSHGDSARASAEHLQAQRNTLAALTESVIGAAFVDHGYDVVAPVVLAIFEPQIEWALDNRVDARSRLQEMAAREGAKVQFTQVDVDGPPHDRRFTIEVQVHQSANVATATGVGRSKQQAQHAAAAAVLELIEQ